MRRTRIVHVSGTIMFAFPPMAMCATLLLVTRFAADTPVELSLVREKCRRGVKRQAKPPSQHWPNGPKITVRRRHQINGDQKSVD